MSDIDQKEDLIVEASNEVDEFLLQLATQHNQHPLNISSIVFARLIVLCKSTGCLDQFLDIIQNLPQEVTSANTEVTKH